MKKERFVTTVIALFAVCNLVSGQDLKPLKSFDNDVEEYLRSNFDKDNVFFKGDSFDNFINSIEAEFLMANIHISVDRTFFILNLNIQSFERLANPPTRLVPLSGVKISFEEGENLTKTNNKMIEIFAETIKGTALRMPLTSENMDQLKDVLSNVKIRSVIYMPYFLICMK